MRQTFLQAGLRLGWGAAEQVMTRSAAAASSLSDDQAPHRRPTICNRRGPSFTSLDGTSTDELLSRVRNGGERPQLRSAAADMSVDSRLGLCQSSKCLEAAELSTRHF